ncbi:alpha/beta fold hydrolase [Thalassobaculum sp. OXR-137]|uniref:thioesterase II family protein n=1 Tax=Thalassobaculum sp. OXR-137 TaxID=3100173 RepID=UPI002AC8E091|nr:alpha/beta fold hydrolase [Thalassobaculum sp. OXR-137]WPZ32671.1 alpha/beta fold hydrolase [Thalassobaculum sp. OXR-137]
MTAPLPSDPWIRPAQPRPDAALRLFCLPYAGGGASIYRTWGEALPDWLEVCAVQLPGREERIGEPAFRQVDRLLPVLLDRLRPHLDRPYALFGHSMGAVIAYETARALEAEGGGPVHLIVSGQRAPHLPLNRPPSYHLSEPAFQERLRVLNGTPAPVLQEPELMKMVLPLLRCDFELSETYRRQRAEPLACPITALGGRDDGEVDPAGVEAWRETTRGPAEIRMFAGDHFFLHGQRRVLLDTVARCLRGHAPVAAETPGGRS